MARHRRAKCTGADRWYTVNPTGGWSIEDPAIRAITGMLNDIGGERLVRLRTT